MQINPKTARFNIGGMDCAGCASKVENAVERLPGVSMASASVIAAALVVTHDGTLTEGAVGASGPVSWLYRYMEGRECGENFTSSLAADVHGHSDPGPCLRAEP